MGKENENDETKQNTVTERKRSPILLVGGAILAVALVALGNTSYKAYILPWQAYGNEEMSYLDRVDPRSLSGGDLTHYHFGPLAFEQEAPNLAWGWLAKFDAGDGVFERIVTPALGNNARYDADGVGPIYNNNFCEACHNADGRAAPQLDNKQAPQEGLLMRLSVPGEDAHGGPKPHPVYGGQFGDRGIPGKGVSFTSTDYGNRYSGEGAVKPEGRVEISYTEIKGTYGDGAPFSLRKPTYKLVDLNYGPLGEKTMVSPRIAPPVFGMGLLEAIKEKEILALADPDDNDGDGISGKPQYAWDPETQSMGLGRFGWKMETVSVAQQSMDAAVNDVGVTNPIFPMQTCTKTQTACLDAIHGGTPDDPEYSLQQMDEVVVYLQLLGVPGRRGVTEEKVLHGEKMFREANCTACHAETMHTGDNHKIKRLNRQTIHPYTDLLLHDMGEGLADNRPSFDATGQEWRTPPLWGIGLVPTVNGHSTYLHDGRARNIAEAILWHGGEAKQAKEKFRKMSSLDREALLFFLESM